MTTLPFSSPIAITLVSGDTSVHVILHVNGQTRSDLNSKSVNKYKLWDQNLKICATIGFVHIVLNVNHLFSFDKTVFITFVFMFVLSIGTKNIFPSFLKYTKQAQETKLMN